MGILKFGLGKILKTVKGIKTGAELIEGLAQQIDESVVNKKVIKDACVKVITDVIDNKIDNVVSDIGDDK